MEEMTNRRLIDGSKSILKDEAEEQNKSVTQLVRDWIETIKRRRAKK